MSGILDRRAKRFISTEQAELAVPSRAVLTARVARDDVNRSEKSAGKNAGKYAGKSGQRRFFVNPD